VVLGAPAWIAERVHALSPTLARAVLHLVARVLPGPDGGPAEPWREGRDIEAEEAARPAVRAVARMGHEEARRYHQI
jgi:hypothetical protein